MATDKASLNLNLKKLKHFQEWKAINGESFSLLDYLSVVSSAEVAIAYTKIFSPDFIEYDGGVFLAEVFSAELYQQWKAKLGDDRSAIERVMNHIHLDDLFQGADKVGIENLAYLGEVLKQLWEYRLRSLYPNRSFQVLCNWDKAEETVVITFSQTGRQLREQQTKQTLRKSKELKVFKIDGNSDLGRLFE